MYEGRRAQSPFDDSAAGRLRRMGLTDEAGKPDRDALAICSRVFAGQFFDDLCDYFESYEDVRELIEHLFESAAEGKQNSFWSACNTTPFTARCRTRSGGSAGTRLRQSCLRRAF